MAESSIILAIRKINDRAVNLARKIGFDNPIVQDYFSKMQTLVPDNLIRENKNGVPQIIRSKEFEKMGYTAERDFNLSKFPGLQELRKQYRNQFKKAKKEKKKLKIDEYIQSIGELQGNIPLLYEKQGQGIKEVDDAISTLQKSNNTYSDLLDVVGVIRGIGSDAENNTYSDGTHTIVQDQFERRI